MSKSVDEWMRKLIYPFTLLLVHIGRRKPADTDIVGGYSRRETPVPIPNTEAKAPTPMVVRERESRSLPTFMRSLRETWGFSFAMKQHFDL